MQAFVEDRVPAAVEPEDLQAIRPLGDEDEEAALERVAPEALAGREGQPIKPLSHVHRLGADEDAHVPRNHRRASRTSSRRVSASPENPSPMRTR